MAEAVDKARLFELLEPAVAAMGFELADLDAHFGRRGLLRLFIDREGGVTLDDCQRVSEQVGAFLDVEDPLPGSYVLEVSSPGFDRRLRTLAHFERFKGENATFSRFFHASERPAHAMFDLPAFIAHRAQEAGIGRFYDLSLCTYGDEARFYSYRRTTHRGEADYGRQISAIVLED